MGLFSCFLWSIILGRAPKFISEDFLVEVVTLLLVCLFPGLGSLGGDLLVLFIEGFDDFVEVSCEGISSEV